MGEIAYTPALRGYTRFRHTTCFGALPVGGVANIMKWTNWVGNQSFDAREFVTVRDEAHVSEIVMRAARAGQGVRTAGTGHSFTPIVETDVLLDTSALSGMYSVDAARRRVTAGPKTTVGEFGEPLWQHGLALANQGDIDTQAIAGAIATATHGSGRRFPCFSATLAGARFVDGAGSIVEVSETLNAEVLPALQTSLGLLGLMTQVTVNVVPSYCLHAQYLTLSYDAMIERFDELVDGNRAFSFFWMPSDASAKLYCLDNAGADDCSIRLFNEADPETFGEVSGTDRLDRAYRIYPMVYDPNFHEMEYFLPLARAREILDAMRKLMRRWLPLSVYPLEVRMVAADDAWMSPNYQRENLVVSVSGEPGVDYWPYLRAVDALFAEFGGRPHWGKLHFMTADRLERLFPRYADFAAMRRRFDPAGVFLNAHTRALFA
jgi:FAD/FMN-containing dehydrogenase